MWMRSQVARRGQWAERACADASEGIRFAGRHQPEKAFDQILGFRAMVSSTFSVTR
jgi:hypothetical protein